MNTVTSSTGNRRQPTDSSLADSLSLLVININRFNTAFAENTRRLDEVIDKLNTPTEAEKAMRQAFTLPSAMEIRQVAEQQHQTLSSMQALMQQYMDEMTRTASVTDAGMRSALSTLKESTTANIDDLNALFISQSEQFKKTLREEKESFEKFNDELSRLLGKRLEEMPVLAERLNTLADIPARLDKLIESVEQSQVQSMVNINRSIRQAMTDAVNLVPRHDCQTKKRPSLTSILLTISTICLIIITIKLIL